MNTSKLLLPAVMCVAVVTLAACAKETTGVSPRTHSVVATASVPATPTAPITLTTNDPESHVSLTFDVTTLQQIAQAVGGAATITVTDIAPVDYGELTSIQADSISAYTKTGYDMKTLVLDIQGSTASVSAMPSPGAPAFDALSDILGFVPVRVTVTSACPPGLCQAARNRPNGRIFLEDAGTLTIDGGTPQTITGNIVIVINNRRNIIVFLCPSRKPVSGASGG